MPERSARRSHLHLPDPARLPVLAAVGRAGHARRASRTRSSAASTARMRGPAVRRRHPDRRPAASTRPAAREHIAGVRAAGRHADHPADAPVRRLPDLAGDAVLLRRPGGHSDRPRRRAGASRRRGRTTSSPRSPTRASCCAATPTTDGPAPATVCRDPDQRSGRAGGGGRARGGGRGRLRRRGDHAARRPAGWPPATTGRATGSIRLLATDSSPLQHAQADLLVAAAAPRRQPRDRPPRPGRRRRSRDWPRLARRTSTCPPGCRASRTRTSIRSSRTSREPAPWRELGGGSCGSTRPKGDSTEQLAEVVKSNLSEIGMDVAGDDDQAPSTIFEEPREPWDVALISWYADRPDPIDFLQPVRRTPRSRPGPSPTSGASPTPTTTAGSTPRTP